MEFKKCIICDNKITRITKFSKKEWINKKYCSRKCKDKGVSIFQSGINNGMYKGGCIQPTGYLCIGKKYKHRMVVEESIGRKLLSSEIVHHINGDKLDNRIENLEIMSRSQHSFHHFGHGKFGKYKIS